MIKKSFLYATALLLLAACSESNSDKTATTQPSSASLATVSGIKYSETTVNPKEEKNVLIISASPRRGGNTDLLADAFVKGATEAGGKVEKIFLPDLDLKFLSEEGANSPKEVARTGDTWMCVEKFLNADVVCLASPTYGSYKSPPTILGR